MRRVVSLFLPSWSTDRLRRKAAKPPEGDIPLVTALPDHGRRIVASVDDCARAHGIRPGMTVTKARMFAADLIVVDADPDDDLEGLRRLALWCARRYAPIVAPDPPDGILIDITGCAHRFDGETPMLKDMLRRLKASGLIAQVAVADTVGCAHAIARAVPSGRPTIIDPGKTRTALSILPVSALRIEAGVVDELRRMGFERIEQLIASPRAPLAKRFGRQLHKRLDQALGQIPEPIEPIIAPSIPRVRRNLLEPIATADAFVQVIGDLTDDLVQLLVADGAGARRLDLLFERVDGQYQVIRVGTATSTRDAPHLAKLLTSRIDTVDPGMGVEAMTLIAPLTEPLSPIQQSGLTATGKRGPDLAALIDALANRDCIAPRRAPAPCPSARSCTRPRSIRPETLAGPMTFPAPRA